MEIIDKHFTLESVIFYFFCAKLFLFEIILTQTLGLAYGLLYSGYPSHAERLRYCKEYTECLAQKRQNIDE